jgi:hypothetical protein
MRGLGGLGAAATLSAAQIQQIAANAGFAGPDLATAVAVALAESSGNASAVNPEGSYGLWQIYLPAHPEFAGWNLADPQVNAAAAFSVYSRAGGFSPWTTYKNGRYQAYLNAVPAGAADTGAGSTWSPPLTIDASTGLPIDDSTPTPAAAVNSPNLLLVGAGALAVYAVADLLFGD